MNKFPKGLKPTIVGSVMFAPISSEVVTNFDRTDRAQKRDGSNPTQVEIDAVTNSIGYVKAANEARLLGFTNWRLPTRKELELALGHSKELRLGDAYYWTSTARRADDGDAWFVTAAMGGSVNWSARWHDFCKVRLVRPAVKLTQVWPLRQDVEKMKQFETLVMAAFGDRIIL